MTAGFMATRLLYVGTLLSGLVGASAAIAREQRPAVDVVTLLPADGVTVDVMQPAFPKRLEELAARLQAAMAKDPEWTKSFLAKAKPGEPLPYDERLGLTRAEYDEFLALSKQGGMTKVATASVRVQRAGSRIVLQFGERFQGMEQIELDLEKDSVSTPAGVVSGRRSIANSSQQSATGPWEGVQWQSAGFGEESSKADVSLAVGRLQGPGRGILYFRVRPRTANAPAVQYILFYDLPKPR